MQKNVTLTCIPLYMVWRLMNHMRHSRCLLSTNIRSFLVKSLFYNTVQPCCRTDGNVILKGIFVSKTAESVFFIHFPLVFSRKSIIFVA